MQKTTTHWIKKKKPWVRCDKKQTKITGCAEEERAFSEASERQFIALEEIIEPEFASVTTIVIKVIQARITDAWQNHRVKHCWRSILSRFTKEAQSQNSIPASLTPERLLITFPTFCCPPTWHMGLLSYAPFLFSRFSVWSSKRKREPSVLRCCSQLFHSHSDSSPSSRWKGQPTHWGDSDVCNPCWARVSEGGKEDVG